MSKKDESTGDDKSVDVPLVLGATGALGTLGMVIGTLAAGPAVGIALALIWAAQTALVAATEHEMDGSELG